MSGIRIGIIDIMYRNRENAHAGIVMVEVPEMGTPWGTQIPGGA